MSWVRPLTERIKDVPQKGRVMWIGVRPAHEVAMVTGMEAALKGVLGKLDPALLTQKIEAKGGFGGFLKNRKAHYWETYEAMYAEISDQAENDFHELFAREFAKAYKDQLARLKAQNQK